MLILVYYTFHDTLRHFIINKEKTLKENKVTLSARIPVSLKTALEVLAAMNDRTMSQELVNRVRQSLTEEEKKIAGI